MNAIEKRISEMNEDQIHEALIDLVAVCNEMHSKVIDLRYITAILKRHGLRIEKTDEMFQSTLRK